MQPWMVDLFLVVVILGVTYALTSEGLWGAALVFFNLLFSVLIALNFYEPLATLIVTNASAMRGWADFICLAGLFLVSLVIFKVITESIAPLMVRFPMLVFQIGRLIFGLGGAVLTVGFLLLLLYTAPVHRKIMNALDYNAKPPFGMAVDRKLLGFFQWTTAYIMPSYASAEERDDPEFGRAKVFDPAGRWLLDHQNARPFPEGDSDRVPPPESEADTSGGGGGDQPAGGGDANAQAAANSESPRIPGGTAGAAAGLAPQGG